jgi:hypothetical protein
VLWGCEGGWEGDRGREGTGWMGRVGRGREGRKERVAGDLNFAKTSGLMEGQKESMICHETVHKSSPVLVWVPPVLKINKNKG